jgi:WD40 repeat protein
MNTGDITSVVRSADHKFTATIAGTTVLWDSAGKFLREFDSRLVSFDPQSRYIAVTREKDVAVYSLKNGQLLSTLKGSSMRLVNASLSRDGRSLVSLTNEDHVKIWSLNFGKVDRAIKQNSAVKTADFPADPSTLFLTTADSAKIVDAINGRTIYAFDKKINSAKLSPDGKLLVVTSGKQGFIKHAVTGENIFIFSEDYIISDAAVSRNGKYAWYIFGRSAAGLVDLDTKQIHRFYLGEENIQHCEFSPDEELFFLLGEKATARLYYTANGSLRKSLSEKSKTEYAVTSLFPESLYLPQAWEGEMNVFTSDGRSLLFRTYMDRYIVLRHLDNIDKPDTIFTKKQLVLQAASIPNSPYIITVTTDDTIRIWQKKNRLYQVVKSIPGNGFKIIPDGKVTILVNDSQLSLLETKSLSILIKAIGMNETDFFTQPGNDPYYMTTKKAVSQLTFRYNGAYFSYEQFDLKFNRPDKVLDEIGYADKKLVASYRKAYVKRLTKLGLDPSSLSAIVSSPVASIKNRDNIAFEQSNGIIDLVFTAADKRFALNKFHIRINEVPLFGSAGLALKRSKTLDTTIKIPLSDSLNVIDASVSNVAGGESYHYPLHVLYNSSNPRDEKLWFVGIGIDSFADNKHNLAFCVKDIRDLALKLKSKFGSHIQIDTLFNEQVTINNVAALRKKLMKSSINDRVILSYSGHGLLSKDFDYYLSTYNVDFTHPEKNGLPFDLLESLLDSIPARKKLMLVDACHSGEVDKEEMQRYTRVLASSGTPGLKGGELLIIDSTATFGMKNSFELMQELFVNLGTSTGATIISAAAGTQLALEKGDLKNGVFTYSILEFMEQHSSATVSELKEYVNRRVRELTNGLQVPTTRAENIMVDWRVW